MNYINVPSTNSRKNTYSKSKANNSSPSRKSYAPLPEKTETRKTAYNAISSTSRTSSAASKSSFKAALKETHDSIYNLRLTENGAVGYASSGSKLLDLNFAVASLRGAEERKIYTMFREAFNEDPVLAMRWLIFARDARGGLGEKNLFSVCIRDMINNGQTTLINNIIPLIPEYGYWKEMFPLLDTAVRKNVMNLIVKQWQDDIANYAQKKPVSLFFKYVPTEQASSAVQRKYALSIMKTLKISARQYRTTVSTMRKYLDVVERKMSSDNWQSIDYEKVPSKANLNYNSAFLKHDETRRRNYLGALSNGEAKINSSVLYPYEIVHKYGGSYARTTDAALEGMWKALPDMVKGDSSTIVVADGSGSMTSSIGKTGVSALDVANSLAIYFAERCEGEFKNSYITFSSKPRLVELGNGTLLNKLKIAYKHSECANTNIEAVFDLILNTAIEHNMRQEQIPGNILIISDMEFDSCAEYGTSHKNRYGWYECNRLTDAAGKTLFKTIERKYLEAGYKMPRLVFWNVNSRTATVPVKQNDFGVALVSGFSVNVCKMVMSGKLDPYECLKETLMDKRYDAVEKAVRASI